MAFYTQIDLSRQIKQSGSTTTRLSGSTQQYGDLWVGNPRGDSWNLGYNNDLYEGNSGYTFIVQNTNTLSGMTNYSDGRVASYGVSITSFSGLSTGNTVLSISQPPLLPVNPGATSVTLTASCLQIATGNLISSSSTDLGIDSLGNIVIDTSSRRFKDEIENIEFKNLDKLLELNPRKFKWKSNGSDDWGYIAEEVESLGLNDFVSYEGGVPHSVKYKKLTILLIAYLKKYGLGDVKTKKVSCNCTKEEFVVLTDDTTYVLDHTKQLTT